VRKEGRREGGRAKERRWGRNKKMMRICGYVYVNIYVYTHITWIRVRKYTRVYPYALSYASLPPLLFCELQGGRGGGRDTYMCKYVNLKYNIYTNILAWASRSQQKIVVPTNICIHLYLHAHIEYTTFC